ncbi:ErfK/YbiS/YcfS/YnhG family protein [Methylobacterium tarhaniae]|uniref:ErfK/YbiS/YcfS/YnhG family protein n=1 Tax=Methylobacterium tarhaniae TaxID=1187852 RepID=A0A0J6SRF2_9HYPH|nr:L,D-transpeptidase [Methylobacterium tarhaniae]KMO37825.1 ErfK/YbiS/YcfS/YnhG family protein [Methylobacterium tarhaniae]
MHKQSGWAAAMVVAAAMAAGPAASRELVAFDAAAEPGTVVVRTAERRLYFVNGDGTAIRYPVAVGKAGKQWTGYARVDGKYLRPAWSPPDEVRRDNPRLPDVIAGGSPSNPMGAAALTLDRGEYAIHGTNRPGSIGTFASYGCIRMYNQDVADLYGRVQVGATVVVTR